MVERLCQVANKIPFWKLLAAHIMTSPFDDHKNNEKKMTTTPVTPLFLAFSSSFSWTLPKQQKKPMIFKLQK
jgi:hypothetical protein